MRLDDQERALFPFRVRYADDRGDLSLLWSGEAGEKLAAVRAAAVEASA